MKEAELCFPQFLNDSCRIPETPNFSFWCLYIVLFFLCLVTTALNMLVILSISHFRQLHTPTNILLLSLAVSDLLVGILVMPFEIILKETCWILGDFMCVLYFLVPITIISSSVGNMVLISIDRYVAICDPLHYPRKVTLRRASLCVSVSWGSAALYSVILLHENLMEPGRYISCRGECFINISGTVDLVVSFIVPIWVIVVLYVRVFVVAVSQARAVKHQTKRLKTVKAKKSEMKAAITLGILVVVFLLCYSPYYCVSLSGHEILIGSYSEVFMIFLMYFNSCLNPVIYALFYPWFRKAMRLILTGQMLRPGSREVRVL
ncbi:trace amine-associated receptor 13c-like [Notolabrus celidotus]|uniref:trace amine-associated receptor 13c-like n=1 Tax=Notolabrus celidotus TaxID=1203425 RepID=UPI00148F58AE|nr:trace amine-associated receptor 13c-like [Notolabrus celidotus]